MKMSSDEVAHRQRGSWVALLAGGVFGIGLAIAEMTRPSKVLGCLDLSHGTWDPSLAFVMFSALAVHALAYRFLRKRRTSPLFDNRFHLPTRRDIDGRLLGGAAIFGVGWGLAGYCPGPGLVGAAVGVPGALVFLVTMTIGIKAETWLVTRRRMRDH